MVLFKPTSYLLPSSLRYIALLPSSPKPLATSSVIVAFPGGTQTYIRNGKGIMTTVPAWCVSAHASFVFKIDTQKTQCLLIALNKMQLLKKIILYVEVIF